MNSAGTYEVNIEVRGVSQAIPGLNIFCGGWKREARQDVGVRVRVLDLALQRKMCTHSGSLVISIRDCSCSTNLQDFEAVGDLSQLRRGFRRTFFGTNDGLDDRGAFQLRNALLALNFEGGSAEVA